MTNPEKNSKPRPDPKTKGEGPISGPFRTWILPAMLAMAVLYVIMFIQKLVVVKVITYSEFRQAVTRGEVADCRISAEAIEGKIVRKPDEPGKPVEKNDPKDLKEKPAAKPPGADAKQEKPVEAVKPVEGREAKDAKDSKESKESKEAEREFNFRALRVEDDHTLTDALLGAKVKFEGERPNLFLFYLNNFMLPLLLIGALWFFILRRIGSAGESVLSFSRNRAKLVADKDTGVTFDDVAGCDEAKEDLYEVVEFLRSPDRYEALGAKIPKGVLLVGPPGTGKTLLARAVAGEAKVPFFTISGSDFVEMFVGVGAARVRDLFQQAKRHSPCIIFIDEMDAIGRQRGVHVGAVNDEREQTLNQLLVEMDGFEANVGVIILAATNRPDVLDRALLRPGRFDRQIVVDAPDIDGRIAILAVHSRDKKLEADVDLKRVAQATPGFSGADLANAMNEAALLAVRREHQRITQHDVEDAVEKVVAGPERKSRRLNEEDKKRVAYHEVGHALVAFHSEHADPVHKISIVPRGRAALGYTLQLPVDDQFLSSRTQLLDRVRGLLGGRAAEEIVFGEISTGAGNDLERATALVQQMICVFGMGDSIGLMHCGHRPSPYLPGLEGGMQLDCSPQTARDVDVEIKKLLDGSYADSKHILNSNRHQLDRVASALLQTESLDAKAFEKLLEEEPLVEVATSAL